MKMRDIRNITSLGREDLLDALGLALKPGRLGMLLRWLGPFGAGLVCGALTALLLAPKTGRDLRRDLRDYLPRGGGRTAGAEAAGHAS
jgi:hypothetical protein